MKRESAWLGARKPLCIGQRRPWMLLPVRLAMPVGLALQPRLTIHESITSITHCVDWHTPRGTPERRDSFAARLKLKGTWSVTMQRVSDTSDLAAKRDMTGTAEPTQAAQTTQPP